MSIGISKTKGRDRLERLIQRLNETNSVMNDLELRPQPILCFKLVHAYVVLPEIVSFFLVHYYLCSPAISASHKFFTKSFKVTKRGERMKSSATAHSIYNKDLKGNYGSGAQCRDSNTNIQSATSV